ncbi:helix-turn-helix domain-containing protein [Halorhodospira halophila]|nr:MULTISPECIES: helix-turn-helix domain-containing protein [Halorhodospira]MCG5528842.1 helix-turn-helix domain-containing protein [Halorhodospira halophila]MCG5544228.1 helix-turn-helix domain-containing protein [Halorhodospira sp. 9628]
MIHRIMTLHDEGRGLSVRTISRELGISRNTVRKHLAQSAEEIALERARPRRTRRLDEHRPFIEYLLRRYPKLSAVKVGRKLREKIGELDVLDRTLRRCLQKVAVSLILGPSISIHAGPMTGILRAVVHLPHPSLSALAPRHSRSRRPRRSTRSSIRR